MVSDGGRRGVMGEAVAAAAGELARRHDEAEQIGMFPVPTRFTGARGEAVQAAIAEQRRRAGRPPGAQNKSTVAMRQWLLSRGADPLQRLMEFALHTPTSLAAELGCTRLEAFRELRALWEACAPFFHGKALPVDDDGKPLPFFQMFMGGAGAADQARPPWKYIEENQPLRIAPDPVSHAAVSHEVPK